MTAAGFYLDGAGYLRSELLDRISGVRHGFGTRQAKPPDLPLATVTQIHGASIREASGDGPQGEADAIWTARPGLAVGVKTADCVPLLLVDFERGVVAAVHAGWRGTVSEIAAVTVHAMTKQGSESRRFFAAIGPAIGECCYQVGPEVASQFGMSGSTHLNLPEINRGQLIAAGIAEDRIAMANICTRCDASRFHSFRRDRESAGRMMSWIGRD